MSTYSNEDLQKLQNELSQIQGKRNRLMVVLYCTKLDSGPAKRYLEHGVMRRLCMIAQTINTLFRTLPPETEEIPDKSDIDLATICIQGLFINTYGLLDCIAHVWAQEFSCIDRKGKPIARTSIGLGRRYEAFRACLTPNLKTKLESWDSWFDYIEAYRHSLAHRIPLYIPPHFVDPKHVEEYKKLDERRHNSLDSQQREKINRRMLEISHFKAIMLFDIEEKPEVYFHAQAIADFLTVEELCYTFLEELGAMQTRVGSRPGAATSP